MAYCTVLFKCSHRRPKHNLFTEKTTFYCPVNNFPLKKKTMYSILGLCETSGNFSSVAKAIRNLHPHSNYWFFNLMQNNFKLTTEQIYKQRLSAAPPTPPPAQASQRQSSKPTSRPIWFPRQLMRLCCFFVLTFLNTVQCGLCHKGGGRHQQL